MGYDTLKKKRCPGCGAQFTRKKFRPSGYCPVCDNLRAREYRERHREEYNARENQRQKRKRRSNPAASMLRMARWRARKAGLPFAISVDDICIPKKCPVFGTKLIPGDVNHSPSLDRVVGALGYVRGNVAVMSKRANRIKDNASLHELRQLVTFLEKFLSTGLGRETKRGEEP